jgi:hypothetical protein
MAREMEINELLIEAFERLEENYTAREKLFLAIIANGKLAQAELKELAQTAEHRRRFGIV